VLTGFVEVRDVTFSGAMNKPLRGKG